MSLILEIQVQLDGNRSQLTIDNNNSVSDSGTVGLEALSFVREKGHKSDDPA